MTQIVDMAAFRGPTAQMVDLSKFTFWGPPQDMDFFYKQSTRTGRAWLRSIHGRTVSYNQLVRNGDFSNGTTGWFASGAAISAVNGVATWTASNTTISNNFNTQIFFINGHTYCISFCIKGNADNAVSGAFGTVSGGGDWTSENYSTAWKRVTKIATPTTNTSDRLYLRPNMAGSEDAVAYFKDIIIVDLTQAGLDSIITTPEQFEAWQMEQFGHKGYLGYTPGTLVNVNPTGVLTTGRNVWDEEWEEGILNVDGTVGPASGRYCSKNYIPCGLASKYYFYLEGGNNFNTICYYDANFALVGYEQARKGERTIPSGAVWAKFGLYSTYTEGHICINISDPSFNGQYEPYNGHTLPLDFTEHFPTGVNGVNNIFDEVVSDENGKFTDGDKRFGVVDLGSLSYAKTSDGMFRANISDMKAPTTNTERLLGFVCSRYPADTQASVSYDDSADKTMKRYNSITTTTIFIKDSAYIDATPADFKAAMSGVPLVYQLATPQHVTFTDPSDAVYPVTEGGTEQVLPVNGSEPTTGPLLGKVSYKQGRSAQ
jgi:hypothetical protein